MCFLSLGASDLTALDAAALFDATMIRLDPPTVTLQLLTLLLTHLKLIGCPMLRVTVWGDRPKHPHQPVPSQMHDPSLSRYLQLRDRDVAGTVRVD